MPKAAAKTNQWQLPAIAHEVYDDYLRGKTQRAIARDRQLDASTVKRYVDALLKEEQPIRAVKRERLRTESMAKLRRVYQQAAQLLEADPENTAAMNVLVRVIREEAKLQGLYQDITVAVEHKGDVTIHVVYKNDWRGTGSGIGSTAGQNTLPERVVDAAVEAAAD